MKHINKPIVYAIVAVNHLNANDKIYVEVA